MNRRDFLKRFGVGVAAAAALAQVPVAVVQALDTAEAGKRLACEYMRRVYNEFSRGRGLAGLPRRMFVSPGLFEAYEGELMANERFVVVGFDDPGSPRVLCFKGARVSADPSMRGWSARCVA
jgi:hypothetical protein